MAHVNDMAEIGALVGDPARAAMLTALMNGRALTAGELARAAGVAPQTASAHLARLAEARLLAVEKQGRHRYHRLASSAVAQLLEDVMRLAVDARPAPVRVGPRDAALRRARVCYDHLAGRLGVAISDALRAEGVVRFDDGVASLAPDADRFLATLGLEEGWRAAAGRRPLCRSCLDWSERRPHLAGALGAALCRRFLDGGLARRRDGGRALDVTPAGAAFLRARRGVRDV